MSGTNDRTISALVGVKRELTAVRATVRDLKQRDARWRSVAQMLRKLAGLSDEAFANVLRAESLTE
ncbi:hypothetical protein CO678_35060 [Bradyrhizobium diazoefficiens]|uniref:hypothetical protein n=1 Tax=Bradyrhizobium diazoefficiens TaxID=1355477 RepID=UPI000BEA4292|nr:hypothetical protein [Bradyrhizobium diazoefficiens]PDT57100.1 hypothetical protein CO678_35060 [Bradyrhizobium diazoefficiens]